MSFSELIQKYSDKRNRDILVGIVCKIKSFDDSSMTADVEPMVKRKNEFDQLADYPILPGIPVQYVQLGTDCYLKPYYKKGDLVWVSFSTFDISDALLNKKTEVDSKSRIFGIENACVIGKIPAKTFVEPTIKIYSESGQLILQNGTTKLILSTSGVSISGTLSANSVTASGSIAQAGTSIGDLKTAHNAQTFPYVSPSGPASTGTTDIPIP